MEATPLLSAQGVSVTYGREKVLKKLSFTLFPGESVLLLGANGSGKTTLLRVLAGILDPEEGVCLRPERIGYYSHHAFLYDGMTSRENLLFFGKLGGGAFDLDNVIAEFGVTKFADKKVESLSRGQKARVSLARVFLQNPEVILLDEPTSFLDQEWVEHLLLYLSRFHQEKRALLFTSHDIERIAPIATRACLLLAGEVSQDSRESRNTIREVVDSYRRSNR